jgi:hypothetical protein
MRIYAYASQWSAVQTCPGEFFLSDVACIVCSVIPLSTNAAYSLPLSREMRVSGGAIYAIYTHTQEALPLHTTHTQLGVTAGCLPIGRIAHASQTYPRRLKKIIVVSLEYVLPTPMMHGVLADSW